MRSVDRFRVPLGLAALLAAGCYDFHLTGPEDAPAVPNPQLVSVTVEYRQPNGCLTASIHCDDKVVFIGSWMQKGAEFALTRGAGNFVWTGPAFAVPVNYPPNDQPYTVYIHDPHLVSSETDGFTGERLKVGGQVLTIFVAPGGPNEGALVYIDQNGFGHNPF